MPTTPNLALPYPTETDTADVPRDIKALADKLDTFSLSEGIVTVLPSSPQDGDEITFSVNPGGGNPVYWRLKYIAALTAPYRWAFLGGGVRATRYDTLEPITGGVYPNWVVASPLITVPLAGVYNVKAGGLAISTANRNVGVGVTTGAGTVANAAVFAQAVVFVAPQPAGVSVSSEDNVTVAAPGNISAAYTVDTAGQASIGSRWMNVLPIRVG